ncbi:MAG: prolyl-tRNA synthetase associated domain-containing protein [Rhodospirillales bacterium]|nr:prolyl-tRNA synthetase associated domain-containing protein [Rhodospirillales bacterium]
MPMTPEHLLARLDELGIETTTHRHPPVFTVEESKRLRGDLPGGHCKNLLLRDHKGQLWLLVALEDTPVDMKGLRPKLKSGRLSFAKSEQLMETLGVDAGSVTPFGLINDTDQRVQVALEERMMTQPLLNFHPLSNAATTAITPDGLLTFIASCGHRPLIVGLTD